MRLLSVFLGLFGDVEPAPTGRFADIDAIERQPEGSGRARRWVSAVRRLADDLERSDIGMDVRGEFIHRLGVRMRIGHVSGLPWDAQRLQALHDIAADRAALAESLRKCAEAAQLHGVDGLQLEAMLVRKVEWRARGLAYSPWVRRPTRADIRSAGSDTARRPRRWWRAESVRRWWGATRSGSM